DTSPAPTPFAQGIAYVPTLESMAIGGNAGVTSGNTIYIIDVDTFTSTHTFTYETSTNKYAPPLMVPKGQGSRYLLCFDEGLTPSHLRRMYYHAETLISDPPSVLDVQRSICLRAGMTTGKLDVSPLSSITRKVRGIVWNDVSNARGISEQLMTAFFYEATLSGDKIKFVPRGGSSVVTIPFDDLGASESGNFVEPLPLKHLNDIEHPARMSLVYPNSESDYQSDTQYTDRYVSASADTVESMTLSIAMTAAEAKSIVETVLMDRIATAFTTKIALLGDYTRLEPTDAVTVTARDGSLLRMRLVKRTDSFPLLEYEAVLDDVSILSQQGITSADYTDSSIVAAPLETIFELMDIPMLLDAHDDAGFYAAAEGSVETWPGAAILKSIDNTTFSQQVTVEEPAIIGRTVTALAGWTGGRVFDEINTVRVNIGNDVLSSTTREAMLADKSINAALIGDDHIIQFRTATLVSTGIYDLSGLLHADHGMDSVAAGNDVNSRFVLLRYSGLRRLNMDSSELGVLRYYKGVTFGRPISSAISKAFTNMGASLKPLSLWDLRAARDGSDNITFTWQRRSRLSTRTVGSLPISIPLGEASEAYEIDIMDGGDVVRTISATATTVAYSATDQATDFGSPQSSVTVKAYQLSETVGRGYELEATV
ncbi:MAG: phage tail protein, partial [Betaproteobacteria bacterium]